MGFATAGWGTTVGFAAGFGTTAGVAAVGWGTTVGFAAAGLGTTMEVTATGLEITVEVAAACFGTGRALSCLILCLALVMVFCPGTSSFGVFEIGCHSYHLCT